MPIQQCVQTRMLVGMCMFLLQQLFANVHKSNPWPVDNRTSPEPVLTGYTDGILVTNVSFVSIDQ